MDANAHDNTGSLCYAPKRHRVKDYVVLVLIGPGSILLSKLCK